jgi:hypothetical protein
MAGWKNWVQAFTILTALCFYLAEPTLVSFAVGMTIICWMERVLR